MDLQEEEQNVWEVYTYKARLDAKGFSETQRIDYDETYSPVAKITSIRIILAIVGFHVYEIWQIDLIIASFKRKLSEDVYMS